MAQIISISGLTTTDNATVDCEVYGKIAKELLKYILIALDIELEPIIELELYGKKHIFKYNDVKTGISFEEFKEWLDNE